MFKKLWIKDFRNYSQVQLDFHNPINIFFGLNGQGKTNLIEAIYLACTGTSFRFSENVNLIKNNTHCARIKAQYQKSNLDFDIQVEVLKSKKNFQISNKKVSSVSLLENFPVVVFSPESLSAIKEGADFRRQLADDFVVTFSKNGAQIISDYKKAQKTRNRILKDFKEGKCSLQQTNDLLESINPSFLRLATHVTQLRWQGLQALLPDLNRAMQSISNSNSVDISVDYVISGQKLQHSSIEELYNLMRNRLVELHAAELAQGSSLVGPHKHDIKFLYDGNDSRFFCSQGQQRALILSFKMAQIVYHRRVHGTFPVLLLDDVLSELDSEKRKSLISFVAEIEAQIFITTTDLDLPHHIGDDRCSVFTVRGGQIHGDRATTDELRRGFHSSP